MPSNQIVFLLVDLVLIAGAARLLGRLAERLGQPAVIGEIAAGILAGPTVLGAHLSGMVFPHDIRSYLSAFANVGVLIFMFLAGLEIDRGSFNGRHWNHLCDIDVEIEGVTSTWAPEWLVDAQGNVNVLVSLSDGCCFTPHLMTATDPSLRSWTTPVPIDGLATCVAPDPDAPPDMPRCAAYGYIDTTVVRHDGRYFAFTKNETSKFIELAVAPTPLGPYTFRHQGDWAGWGTPREGQSVIPLPDGGWRIFFDAYTERRYYFSDSYDNFETWTPPEVLPKLSGTIRHCTVLAEYIDR